IVDRVGFRDLATVGVERLVPGRGYTELVHAGRIVQRLVGLVLHGSAGLTLLPAMGSDHVEVEGVRRAGALPAVSLDDVQLVARRLYALDLVRHVIRQQPEGRPRADGVGANEPAFEVTGRFGGDAAGVVLHRTDQAGAMGLVVGPDTQVGIDLGKGGIGRVVTGEGMDAEVLPAVRRFVIVILRVGFVANGKWSGEVVGEDQ